jgi:hypothetical protein
MTAQASAGTIPYMAPEQIQAQARAASDQYALGIVVYEWLGGEYPFDGSFTEIIAKHLMMPPPSLRQKVPALSSKVEQVVMTALAKDPNQRFGSVQAFATALEEASYTTQKSVGALFEKAMFPQVPSSQSLSSFSTVATPSSAQAPLPIIDTSPSAQMPSAESLSRRKLSRRTAIMGLAVLGGVAVGGGVTGWILSSHPRYSDRGQSTIATTPQVKQAQSNVTATAQDYQAQGHATATSVPSSNCGSAFSDTFQSKIHSGWIWVDPTNQASYAVNTPGTLAITAPTNTDLNATTNYEAPRLLQPISGNFIIETQVQLAANPPSSFWAAGLLVWQDQNNFFRVELNTRTFDFEQELNGVFYHHASNALASATITTLQAELKILRSEDTFSAYYRLPGQAWQLINTASAHLQNLQAGLLLVNVTGAQFTAYYHYFKVTCS